MNIGPTELIIVLVIVLVIFGPKRLPALARSLGGGIKEFKESIGSKHDEDDDDAAAPADSATRAQAALGRPGEPVATGTVTGTASPEGETISERR